MTSPTSEPEIPNFDGMSKDELWEFWTKHRGGAGWKQLGIRRKVVSLYASYACNMAVAMSCRKDGNITSAQVYELICDSIYQRIPKEFQW